MRPQRQTTEVEVLVIISPPSDEDLRFRVAMHRWQLQDMRKNESYAEAVFEVFAVELCERLELDAGECRIRVNLNVELLRGAEDDAIYTGDVFSETLFLH